MDIVEDTTFMFGLCQRYKSKKMLRFVPWWEDQKMSKICIVETANTFGALKLIEQLYMDGEIPGHVFRNIIKQ